MRKISQLPYSPIGQNVLKKATIVAKNDTFPLLHVLLHSHNQMNPEFDQLWIAASQRRLDELRSGTATGISVESVMARLQTRFPK